MSERLSIIHGGGEVSGGVQKHLQNDLQERMNVLASGMVARNVPEAAQDVFVEQMSEVRRMAGMLLMPVLLMDERARLFTKGEGEHERG